MPEQVVIIGSGPAGLTAAIYVSRANLKNILFEGFLSGGIPGGQLMITGVVENFPGFKDGIHGQKLMAEMKEQAIRTGARMITEDVDEVDLSVYPFKVISSDKVFETQSLIIATGATARRLPLESEKKFWTKGISACAVCDGALPIFRNKPLAIVGGGDSSIEEALHLAQFGSKVFIVHRRNEFRASKIMQKRAYANPKIEILWNKVVVEFIGDGLLKAIKLLDTVTGNLSMIEVAGAFEAIGHQPNTAFLKGQLPINENGYIITKPGSTETIIPGVFAAGDVQDSRYRQAITAAASGCMAAQETEWWLQKKSE
jgi:thioredoxin reductase (NADPH)